MGPGTQSNGIALGSTALMSHLNSGMCGALQTEASTQRGAGRQVSARTLWPLL